MGISGHLTRAAAIGLLFALGAAPALADNLSPDSYAALNYVNARNWNCYTKTPDANYKGGYLWVNFRMSFGIQKDLTLKGNEILAVEIDEKVYSLATNFDGYVYQSGGRLGLILHNFDPQSADVLPNGGMWDTEGQIDIWIQPKGDGTYGLAGRTTAGNGAQLDLVECKVDGT